MPLPSEMERRITEIVAARFKQPWRRLTVSRGSARPGPRFPDPVRAALTLEEELGISNPRRRAVELRTLKDVLDYSSATLRLAGAGTGEMIGGCHSETSDRASATRAAS